MNTCHEFGSESGVELVIPGQRPQPGHHIVRCQGEWRPQGSPPQLANNPPILRNLIIHGMFKPSHDGCLYPGKARHQSAVTRFIGFSLNVFEAELGI